MRFPGYKRFRWFYTSSGKLVVGGKNAKQNEELVIRILRGGKERIMMHTSKPGSPFAVIIAEPRDLRPEDIHESAVFTACFSKAWKQGKTKARVDIFSSRQVVKRKEMKEGTFGVVGKIESKTVRMILALVKQKNTLRAVPLETATRSGLDIYCVLYPGKRKKEAVVEKIEKTLKEKGIKIKKDELMQVLPPTVGKWQVQQCN